MLNNRLHILYLLLLVFIAGCEKNETAPQEPAACISTNMTNPDSVAVLFVTPVGNRMEIHQLYAGTETTVITNSQYDFWWPQWSPDEQFILCYRSPAGTTAQMNQYSQASLWKFNADGTGGHAILNLTDFGWNAMGYARWAPDGKRIIMAAANEDPNDSNNEHWHLYVTDTSGNNPVKVSTRSSYFANPDIAPDFQHIAYTALVAPAKTGTDYQVELHIATLDTNTWSMGTETVATSDLRREDHVRYSPGGTYIAFHSSTYLNDYVISTVSANGSGLSTIANNGVVMSDAVWDSQMNLLFVYRYGTYCLNHLVTMSMTGTNSFPYHRKLNQHYFQPDL